ncbi:MAG: CHASE2 domain-containing protein [Desulfitobacteriia bacterium]
MKKILAAVILCWVMVFLVQFDSFYFVENTLSDKLTLKTRPVDPRIKILAIDEDSLDRIGSFPWPRDKMAGLIDIVAAGGATAVWPDILFTEPSSDPDEDLALAQVVDKYDNVYLPVYFDFQALQKPTRQLEQEYLKLPAVDIPAERIGHINILTDKDNVVRKVLLGIPNLEEEIVPIIDVRLANLLLPEDSKITWDQYYNWQRGQEEISIDERLQVGFAYASSPAESKFEVIPAWRVMEGEIKPAYFEGSLVLIGPYAEGLQDQYNTPISRSMMNGVEVHANIIQALLDNELYTKTNKSRAIMIVILVTLGSFALFAWAKARRGAVILAFLILGYSGIVYYIYNSHKVLLPYFYILLAFILTYVATMIGEYLKERQERNRVSGIFGRYVSKEVVNDILSAQEEIKLGGVRKDVTLMFVDIRGFTSLSEKMEPEDVLKNLNEYLELCTKAIFQYEGTLDKFIGDGAVSIFGAPLAQEDHAERAVRAALEIRDQAEELAENLRDKYGKPIYFGIGINSGPAVIGNIGSQDRHDFTAIGDTVNLAAWLEANAKPGQILISKETYERVKDIFECTACEPIRVKGKEKLVEVYQVEWELDDEEYDDEDYDDEEYDNEDDDEYGDDVPEAGRGKRK